jgi:hypothetical protein
VKGNRDHVSMDADRAVFALEKLAFTISGSAALDYEKPRELTPPRPAWLDTGTEARHGDLIRFAASGTIHLPQSRRSDSKASPAAGWIPGIFPLNDANACALRRIGDSGIQTILIDRAGESDG